MVPSLHVTAADAPNTALYLLVLQLLIKIIFIAEK